MSQSSIAACNAGLEARNALFNNGTVEIKTGAEPDIDGSVSGSVLEVIALPSVAFNSPVNRVSTINTVSPVTSVSSFAGGLLHYVAKDASGNIVGSGSAGTTGTDMIINKSTWAAGESITISSWTTTQPK